MDCSKENWTESVFLEPRPVMTRVLKYLVIILATVCLIKEVLQFCTSRWRYLQFENLNEWIIYICSIVAVCDFDDCQKQTGHRWERQYPVGAVGIFLAWMNLLLFMRKVPRYGIYIVMFTDIVRTFCRFFFVFVLFIIAFGLSFYVLLSNHVAFQSVQQSMLKTFVMMIGEMEFEAMFNGRFTEPKEENRINFIAVTYALFVAFLILSLLVMNLLVGLAVDDIQGVQAKAQLKRFAMQVELALSVEAMLPLRLRRYFTYTKLTLFPNRPKPPLTGLLCCLRFFASESRPALLAFLNEADSTDVDPVVEAREKSAEEMRKLKLTVSHVKTQNKKLLKMMRSLMKKEGLSVDDDDDDDDDDERDGSGHEDTPENGENHAD